jgi:hypothetical protein
MTHTRKKQKSMKKHMRMLAILLIPVVAFILMAAVPELWADDDDEIPFDEAEIFFELNNTDGDLGIHAKIDGEGWKRLRIEDPRERKMLDIKVKGRLRKQGLTELFFESAEPTFDELDPADFFNRFPEGEYEIEGITLDGEELESEVELTHVMPAPAGGIELNGVSVDLENVDCEEEFNVPSVTVTEEGAVTIDWAPVTMSHPDPDGGGAGVQPPVPVTINNYEVVVEVETEDEFESVLGVILPPDVTSFTIPADYIDLSDEFKYEILAREVSYNQTAVESCFVLE